MAIGTSSCSIVHPARALPSVSDQSNANRNVARLSYDISIPQLEFLRITMRFSWDKISAMLLVSRVTRATS